MNVVPRSDRARLLLAVGATAAIITPIGWLWYDSLLPDTYDITDMGYADYGGGPRVDHHDGHAVPVAELVESRDDADVEVTLTAAAEGDRYLLNGSTPGPTIEATQGDLVEVTLVNDDVDDGVALHWHGIDVPNAMDGVAGVTQDAVGPGETYTYRFVVEDAGTYWYHSHQVSHEQVRKGLLGAIVVHPVVEEASDQVRPAVDIDKLALVHRYAADDSVNGVEGIEAVDAEPGDSVRVRVINTNNNLLPVWVTGAPYKVLAIDGRDLNAPTEVGLESLTVPAGGRADLGIVVPEGGVRVDFGGTAAMAFGGDPTGDEGAPQPDDFVDLLSYGSPAQETPDFSDPDRQFDYSIGRRLGFLDGKPGRWWTINGHMFPNGPMFMVEEGDVVVFSLDNDSGESHPMHLHGHHALVLSRNGRDASGSPWWVDSLEVAPGEEYEIAFVADNPGIWMDHCHNLPHAAEGLTAHLMYAGVTSSYKIGDDAGNEPE